MKRVLPSVLFLLAASVSTVWGGEPAGIQVDKKGVMRRSDTGDEVSFFGVNYTLPFAHAYRAMEYLGVDHKEAIDRDVYHFARLGFNAYRIHIWDVEISDAEGNLVENHHLDLLDYLICKLKERGIGIVLTAQTNFGNGYPERNRPTGGFSYLYDKCDVHRNPEAIAAQERYIAALVSHVNPYTGEAYMDDHDVVGFEINNEPCHAGTQEQTRDYIDRMLAALRKAGNRKPVFYNVSHNMQQTEAYYSTAIAGTTYQWYPTGLVAGRTRSGNFLPFVDEYDIPFDTVRGFDGKARLVYEYDPADITYSHIHPAMARSFRTAGFQWITQFAYDPIDMAGYNTEYQTHFLNLAYTPQKALGMKIAAEVAYSVPRGRSYGTFPADTVFGAFRVSYREDLSEMNTPEKFFHSNHTSTVPVEARKLESVAGYGNSPIVEYEGTGAYFIDRLEEGLWRLEVMPDAVQVSDPFAKPSLEKEVVKIIWNNWDMTIRLPGLGGDFAATALHGDEVMTVENNTIRGIGPGVYLLRRKGYTSAGEWISSTRWANIRLGEFVAPEPHAGDTYSVFHNAAKVVESGVDLTIEAQVAGASMPDSVLVYTDRVSFWGNGNRPYRMERTHGYTYRADIPGEDVTQGKFRYNIVVFSAGEKTTFPAGTADHPLDWDYASASLWESVVTAPDSAVNLFTPGDTSLGMEYYTMPEWSRTRTEIVDNDPVRRPMQRYTFEAGADSSRFFLRRHIADDVAQRLSRLNRSHSLCLYIEDAPETIEAGFVTDTGYTYKATLAVEKGVVNRIPLSALRQTATALLPHSYPIFLKKYFEPRSDIPFRIEGIEQLEISFDGDKERATSVEIGSIWVE